MENEMTFEKALKELEEISQKLNENIELNESLKLYERGVSLLSYCNKELENAQQKVNVIQKNSTEDTVKEFND